MGDEVFDEDALQVQRLTKYPASKSIVMGGEALQRLSNGLIFAAKHRVGLTGDKDRHSLAFFYDPNPEAMIEPLKEFQVGNKQLYPAKLAGHKGIKRNL